MSALEYDPDDVPDEVRDVLANKVWIETAPCGCVSAPCGCVSAAVVAASYPTKSAAMKVLGRRKETWPITLVTNDDGTGHGIWLGCSHAPKWKAPKPAAAGQAVLL